MSAHEEQDPWVYFVHGTTSSLWKEAAVISAEQGGGDFGVGFYLFEDTPWGRQSAAAWASRKAEDEGSEPMLVRVRIRRSAVLSLDREDVSDDDLDRFYNRMQGSGRTGKQLIVGSVGKRGRDGRRIPNRSLPRQFKFEGSGVVHLTLDEIIAVR